MVAVAVAVLLGWAVACAALALLLASVIARGDAGDLCPHGQAPEECGPCHQPRNDVAGGTAPHTPPHRPRPAPTHTRGEPHAHTCAGSSQTHPHHEGDPGTRTPGRHDTR